MELNWMISAFILFPLLGFVLTLVLPARQEHNLSVVAVSTAAIQLAGALVFFIWWLTAGSPVINIAQLSLYKSTGYEFLIDFYFDKVTAVYLITGAFLTFLITRYSRYYLHRETGYKRFFNTILFFYSGYNITVFAGNFETLFAGWEILGISSFLLIAFYRDRYLPVRNAVKVFSIYRIGDVGILLAMWASHHLWHENITFFKLNNYELVHEHLIQHSQTGFFISFMLLIAAAAKSAQLPFSSWLPRAMEGPTPSSAIFYGSLSVHFGVFLLLRTYPFWEHQMFVRICIALLGLSTAIVSNYISRVQPTIKSQIAYASITQIGIMFIEIAAGLHILALVHFAGNAFLRTYQLLVSPAVVSYMIREQFYHFVPRVNKLQNSLPGKIISSLYIFSLKEWNLDLIMNRMVFSPFKKSGRYLDFLNMKNILYVFIPVFMGSVLLRWNEHLIPGNIRIWLPVFFSFTGFMMVLKSFSERKSPILAWVMIALYHCWIALAVSFNEHFDSLHLILYFSGIIPASLLGYFSLKYLKKSESGYFDLNQYYGHVYEYKINSALFFLACLGLMGFPISPGFIGEDLIFSHIHEDQFLLAALSAMSFILAGISLMRMYARLYLGPHIKTTHESPYKAS